MVFRPLALAVATGIAAISGSAQVAIPLEIRADPVVEQIGGVPVTLGLSGRLRLTETPDGAVGELSIVVDLADLQAKILSVVRAQGNRAELCGDRLDLRAATLSPPAPSKPPTPRKIGAGLYVAGRYEWYFCRPAIGDLFNPGPPRLLFRQDGAARFELVPRIGPQGIVLDTHVLGVAADGALEKVLDVRALGEFLRSRLTAALARALGPESLRLALPRDLAELRPKFERVRFVDLGGGKLGLVTEGKLRIPLAAFERLGGAAQPP
ncbi:MAG TPA: hypothetical protein VN851_25055 [Thermoanaerobaculia bacterium]|nr:hypothetical protein [Thermoanaerobaculia bacterium]